MFISNRFVYLRSAAREHFLSAGSVPVFPQGSGFQTFLAVDPYSNFLIFCGTPPINRNTKFGILWTPDIFCGPLRGPWTPGWEPYSDESAGNSRNFGIFRPYSLSRNIFEQVSWSLRVSGQVEILRLSGGAKKIHVFIRQKFFFIIT